MQRTDSFSAETSQQQQIQDLLLLAYTQREQNVIPRVDSVRYNRSAASSIELTLLRSHVGGCYLPESATGCELAISLAIRLPDGFPLERPMIACVAGGEFLPANLWEDGQLSLPWLRDGWPHGYTLVGFVRDVCTELMGVQCQTRDDGSHIRAPQRPSSPSLMLMDSPPKMPAPSAPTYNKDADDPHHPRAVVDPLAVLFKCKWRNTQHQFHAIPPVTLSRLLALLRQHISSLVSQRNGLRLVEFNSSRTGAVLSTEQHWHALLKSGVSTIFILINESPSLATAEALSVDLLGLHDAAASPPPLVHPLRIPLSPSPSKPLARAPPSPSPEKTVMHRQGESMNASNVRRILWEELQIGKIIGNGSSCRVYNATWRGTNVAVKVFTGTNRSAVEKEFANEVSTMARLGAHPSLVLFLAVTQQPLSIVFEFLPFSLFELINGVEDKSRTLPPFPSSWTKRVTMMLDIAKGLQFLHSFDIIHRDMKSLNLLVTPEGRVKLADFGISRAAQQSDLMTGCCGTYQWMAPEVLQSAAYSVSADIYSFGIIMWEICEAAPPFADLSPPLIPAAVLRDKKRPHFSSRTPLPLQQLAQLCWQEDAVKRPSAAEIATTLTGFFHRT